jgi:VWFA-related protein
MRLQLAVILLIAAASLSAQRAPEAITLDVIVDGVSGRQPLGAGDFQVTEAGQPVPLDAVRFVQPSAAPAALPAIITDENEETAASAAERLVAIYIDEYHLADDQAFASSRSALAAFVRDELGPRDLVVVLKPLDSLLAIRMTADRDAAARIIDGAVPRMGDYTARSAFEQNFIAGAPARIDAARSQIALSSVSALATHLGRFDAGRKTLIVMSNGFPAGAPVSRRDQVLPGLESIARVANRERVAIYVVQPTRPTEPTRDVAAASNPGTRDALSTLAQQTTGFVIGGGDRVSEALRRIAVEASHYYLLMLAPAERQADGRFRNVEVAVRRQGAQVRARPGYAIRRPAAAMVRRSVIPEGLKVPRHSSALIRTWFGQSATTQGDTRVEFVWEPAPPVPGVARGSATPSRVAMTVTTLEGTPVFSGSTSASSGEALIPAGQVPQLAFEVSPGSLLVQMDIYDAAGRVVDHDVRDLVVTRFDDPLAFGTAAFYRARTMPALRAIAEGRSRSAPVAARQFSRAEQLLVRMPLTIRGGGDVAVTARLESRFGSTLREVPVSRVSPAMVEVQLPLAGLASGGYALAFEARGPGASARARVDFAVTP